MIKFAFQASALTILTICLAGCGGESKETTSSADKIKRNSSSVPLLPPSALGQANEQRNKQLEGEAQALNTRGAASSRAGSEGKMSGQKSGDSLQQDPAKESMDDSNEVALSRNGLFPPIDMGGGDMGQQASAGFGGGLFPKIELGDTGEMDRDEIQDGSDLLGSSGNPRGGGRGLPSGGTPGQPPEDNVESEMADADSDSKVMAEKANDTLLVNAKKFFQTHNEADAINTIYVNHLVNDDARSNYPLSWFPGLKEPRLFFRWGVGVVFNQPRDFDGRHPVLGDPGDENEKPAGASSGGGRTPRGGRGVNGGLGTGALAGGGGRGSRGRSGGARTYKNIDTSRPDGTLMYYTGDFGQQLISHLESRRKDSDSPYYGQILKDVMDIKTVDDEPVNSGRSRRPTRGGARGSIGIASGGTPSRGIADDDGDDEEEAAVIDRAMGRTTATQPDDDLTGSIIPGVQLLGVGKKVDLVRRARAEGVDMLIMFTVKVSKSRGAFFSTSNMKIVNVTTEENVFSSKPLKDNKVAEAVEDGDDPVRDEVEKAFESVADKMFKAAELPKGLTEDNVKKRVGRLLKQSGDNPLPAAVEIVSFYQAKLLSSDLAKTALKRLFDSDESQVLVSGTSEERMEYLKQWLPKMAASEDG